VEPRSRGSLLLDISVYFSTMKIGCFPPKRRYASLKIVLVSFIHVYYCTTQKYVNVSYTNKNELEFNVST
jgi:hypothetical protein